MEMAFGFTSKRDWARRCAAVFALVFLTIASPGAALAEKGKFSTWRDLPYGDAARQTLDVYAPNVAKGAPIILMVHGGGWMMGDKANSSVYLNKSGHYLAKGYMFVSMNYRLVPDVNPVVQAQDVAQALRFVQVNAKAWGGDAERVVLMGHSAGAHLISLVHVDPAFTKDAAATPPLAAVSLDSGAYDVSALMKQPHAFFFDRVFGKDKDFWRTASPLLRIAGKPAPMLLVCSSRRKESCAQSRTFQAALAKRGAAAQVAAEDLSHRQINVNLGQRGAYTQRVDAFLRAQGLP
jgi:arylformamidase